MLYLNFDRSFHAFLTLEKLARWLLLNVVLKSRKIDPLDSASVKLFIIVLLIRFYSYHSFDIFKSLKFIRSTSVVHYSL